MVKINPKRSAKAQAAERKLDALAIHKPSEIARQEILSPEIVSTLAPMTESSWWIQLSTKSKQVVMTEGQALAQAMLLEGRSKLAIGEHLTHIQAILEPRRVFGRFLNGFHLKKRTAYRYIAGFAHAEKLLPEPILKAAMIRGMNLIGETEEKPLGIYTDAVKRFPVPEKATPKQAAEYLDALEERRKAKAKIVEGEAVENVEMSDAVKIAFKTVSNLMKRLPEPKGKNKMKFLQAVVGMCLTEIGVASQQTFEPQAVPDEFRIGRGRPRLVAQA